MKRINVYAAVIGGGASGMMCAARAAQRRPGKRIVIFEKAERVGKKLMVTGNGRCNLSNIGARAENYHGEGSEELINILYKKYSPAYVLEYFRSIGLMTRTDSEGRVYPLSNSAASVLDVLRRRLNELGVEEICSAEIKSVKGHGRGFEITAADACYTAEKLIIACGGRADYAGRIMGSNSPAGLLGLRSGDLSPSLSPVRSRSNLLPPLKGLRADAEASLYQNGRLVKAERGEVQFTENALSGICIFNLSRYANTGGGEIRLDLLPDMDANEVSAEISARVRRSPSSPVSEILTGIFRRNIGLAVLKSSAVKPSAQCKDISDKELKTICDNIKGLRFECDKSSDYSKAQVTAGGVMLSEIDPVTFEAKRIRNLYVIGEALDVDGDCGGYNLQFAWASGMAAGDRL